MTKLIGLTGRARSGKDTVGNILHDNFDFSTLSFADPIRKAVSVMFNLNDEHLHGSLKEVPLPVYGKSPRQLMQTLGTEWGRKLIRDDVWILRAKEYIDARMRHGGAVVVTDVRFENEADMIRSQGGRVWHIRREGIDAVAQHASEAGIEVKLGDRIIHNDGTIEDLTGKVAILMALDNLQGT